MSMENSMASEILAHVAIEWAKTKANEAKLRECLEGILDFCDPLAIHELAEKALEETKP